MPAQGGLIRNFLDNPLIATPPQPPPYLGGRLHCGGAALLPLFCLLLIAGAAQAAPTEIPKLNTNVGSGMPGAGAAQISNDAGSASAGTVIPSLGGGSLVMPDSPVFTQNPPVERVEPVIRRSLESVPGDAPPAAVKNGIVERSPPKAFGRRVASPQAQKSPAADGEQKAANAPQVGSKRFQQDLQRVQESSREIQQLAGGKEASAGTALQAGLISSSLFDFSASPASHAPDPAVSARGGRVTPAARGLQPAESGSPTRVVIGKLRAGSMVQGRERGPASIPGIETIAFDGFSSNGNSGETTKVRINGELWFLKRIDTSPDADIDAMSKETRALNEAGVAQMLRGDPVLSQSFSVAETVQVFRDGQHVFVLSKGIDVAGETGSKRHEMSAAERADMSIAQLVYGLGDLHGANILAKKGGGYGLIDFEKLSHTPLKKATPQEIDTQVMLKSFPLVDRLSFNDPEVYRTRFEAWKAQYRSGGRDRMAAALQSRGWTAAEAASYLKAVDQNLETYNERLAPYLEYANGWHRRIQNAQAEKAKKDAEPAKGFFSSLFGGGKKGFGARGVDVAGRSRAEARVDSLLSKLRATAIRSNDLLHFTDGNALVGILSSGKLLPSIDPGKGEGRRASNAVHGDGVYFAQGKESALYHLNKDGRATMRWTLRETGAVSSPIALRVRPGSKLRIGRGGPDGVPVNGSAELTTEDLSFLYQRQDAAVRTRMSAKQFAAYARRNKIGGIPLSELERFDADSGKWVPLDSSWRKLKRGLGFGAATGRSDPPLETLGWMDWGRRQLARGLEWANRHETAAPLYESIGFLQEAANAYERASLPGEAARLLYANYGRSGEFRHLLEAETKLKNQLYGRDRAQAKPEHKTLLESIQQKVREIGKSETTRLTAEAEMLLADGQAAKAARRFLQASEMAMHFSFDARRELRGRAEAADKAAEPVWSAPQPARTAVEVQGREAGLKPADIPDGLLGEKAMESFFSERLLAARRKTAGTLRGLQRGVEDGIVFFGDNQGANDAIENARRLRTRFLENGDKVLIISGHGGPLVEGQKVKGTHLLDAQGKNAAWFPDNAWGGLELLDVLARIGVSLEGYEKIVFATCHGGSACGISEAVDIPVLGTDREGWLHYSSNLVVNPQSGFNYGMFLRDDAATKVYRGGKEEGFSQPVPGEGEGSNSLRGDQADNAFGAAGGPLSKSDRAVLATKRYISGIAAGLNISGKQRYALMEMALEEQGIRLDSELGRTVEAELFPERAGTDGAPVQARGPILTDPQPSESRVGPPTKVGLVSRIQEAFKNPANIASFKNDPNAFARLTDAIYPSQRPAPRAPPHTEAIRLQREYAARLTPAVQGILNRYRISEAEVTSHGTTLRAALGMLLEGELLPTKGFGDGSQRWAAKGTGGASYTARAVGKGEPGAVIIMDNRGNRQQHAIDYVERANVMEDFLAIIVTDGTSVAVLDKAAVMTLASSAAKMREKAADYNRAGWKMADLDRWEALRARLNPTNP